MAVLAIFEIAIAVIPFKAGIGVNASSLATATSTLMRVGAGPRRTSNCGQGPQLLIQLFPLEMGVGHCFGSCSMFI
jgi:hypothetical protein